MFFSGKMLKIYLLFLLPMFWIAKGQCPAPEDLEPFCMCREIGSDSMMSCNNVLAVEYLVSPIKSTIGTDMFSILIMNSSLLYIPSKLFKDTNYKKIRFLSTELMSLSDSDLAFIGLEETLEEIRVSDAHYVAQWEWSQLANMRRLQLLEVTSVVLTSIDEPFPSLPSLTILGILEAGISYIHNHAFEALKGLKIFSLKGNGINDLQRNMFPRPAQHLTIMDLSSNQLSSFPEDMFEGMPSLSDLILNNNKFATLTEASFSWPLQHLASLSLKGNQIRCDCRLRWLVKIKKPSTFDAVCSLPENLKDVPVKDVSLNVLWC